MSRLLRSRSAALAILLAMVVSLVPVRPALALSDTGPSSASRSGHEAAVATATVYLPNVVRMLGGPDGWQTPFIVQNVGATTADIEMSFYAFADGSLIKTRTVAGLRAGTSVFHDPNSDTELPAGGQFSVVVRSFGSPIVAVVNEHQNVQSPTRQEALSYGGLSSGSTAVFLPYVAKNVAGWLTTIIIQNLGSATANVSARFVAGTASVTLMRTIGPGRSQFIDPNFEPTLAAGTEYAATVTSDQPVGVVVNAHNDAATVTAPRGFSYNGQAANSDEATFLPYVARRSDAVDRTSRVFIQNAGAVAAAPKLTARQVGDNRSAAASIDGPSVAPGAVWVWDPLLASQINDGDHAVEVSGGKFAAVSAVLSPTTAMGSTATSAFATKLYLPNITRTLGGPSGWTTPIIVQSTGAPYVTLRWYRFSDGSLVHTQEHRDFLTGGAIRIDPRSIPQLSDDSQYAVVIEAASGGAAAVVVETNAGGGDSTMSYDAFPRSTTVFGTSACDPATAPAGTTFHCTFYGLTPGAAPIMTQAPPGRSPVTTTEKETIAADGSWTLRALAVTEGQWSISLTTGALTRTVQFFVSPGTFSVQMTASSYGSIAARTTAGLLCWALVTLPEGSATPGGYLSQKNADASGNVSWTYSPVSGARSGQGTNTVRCYSADQRRSASGSFTVP